jgi:hypothetical protein
MCLFKSCYNPFTNSLTELYSMQCRALLAMQLVGWLCCTGSVEAVVEQRADLEAGGVNLASPLKNAGGLRVVHHLIVRAPDAAQHPPRRVLCRRQPRKRLHRLLSMLKIVTCSS